MSRIVKAGFLIGAVDPRDVLSEVLDEGTVALLAEEEHVALPPPVQDPQQWVTDTIDVFAKGDYEGKHSDEEETPVEEQ